MPEFRAWPKITRLNRPVVVTEKIDGTNAAIVVDEAPYGVGADEEIDGGIVVNLASDTEEWEPAWVGAQSRKRLIAPGKQTDNHGFAGWVCENAKALAANLGHGYHYGEWYGKGINRGYGLDQKRFALFNVVRYADAVGAGALPDNVEIVPQIAYLSTFNTAAILSIVDELRTNGSLAAPGQPAEGVVVFHEPSHHLYKVLCENDELPKGVVGA